MPTPIPLLRFRIRQTTLLVLLAVLPWAVSIPTTGERSLSFYHTHTKERLTVTYYREGQYLPEAMARLNLFLGDFRTGHVANMDPILFDVLYDLRVAADSDATFEVISAYRSPATNKMLRRRSKGVASKSQHLFGKAIDVRLKGVDTAKLRDIALSLERGGVGYYRKSDFIHVDTGRVRRW